MNVDARRRVIRLRVLAVRAARRIGGLSAVRTLAATLETFDTAGGGLVAGGLAYATLVAILPGLLLVVTVVGFVVNDLAVREQLVESIARAVPPLEELARLALDQVAGGAVPTSILALIGLIWGSSRFYAALDSAFARVFRNAPRRGALRQTARGIVLTGLFAAVPVGALTLGAVASAMLDAAPFGVPIAAPISIAWQLLSPLASVALFVTGTALVYRLVPARHIPLRTLVVPAVVVGVVLALFTQLFSYVAPRLVGTAALYGTFVAVFALLAWLSISYNLLLLGAAWTRVRLVGVGPAHATRATAEEANLASASRPGGRAG